MKKTIACVILMVGLLLPHLLWAQQTVTGKVKDAQGNPLTGASVIVKGSNRGTTTDNNGNFSISVSPGETLVFNHVGMTKKEFAIGAVPAVVTLAQSTSDLEDVVVVGYGTQRKSVVTGSISRVKSSDLANMPINRVDDALQGRAAGITIASNNGQPGSAATVRVRGITSFRDNNPLWVVDGVVIDAGGIGYLNSSDIESIEVLKDAASQAIYGARAAAGVILITTKKGKSGKTRITYNGFYGISAPAKKLDLLNASQYVTLRNEAAKNSGQTEPFPNPPQSYGEGTDWQDEIFNKSASRHNHEVSISGGSERSTFYLSFGYLDQEGIVATEISRYKRMNIRLNSTHKLASWLSFGQNLGYAHDKSIGLGNTNSEFGGPLSSAINLDPLTPAVERDTAKNRKAPYTNKGVVLSPDGNPYGISGQVGQEITNPKAYIQTRLGNYGWSDNFVGNAYLEATPIKGLKLRSTLGGKLSFWGSENFTPVFYLNASTISSQTSFRRTNNKRFDWNIENTISYTRSFGDHNATLLVGQGAYRDNNTNGTTVTYFNIPASTFKEASLNFNVPAAQRSTSGEESLWHNVSSYFARLNYDYKEKYLLQALVRRDGSSRFASRYGYGTFPSVNVGWVVSKEDFFPVNTPLSFLKIRGGYGVVGNDAIGDLQFVSTIGSGRNYAFGTSGSYAIGYSPNTLSNPNLKWEETHSTNVGFDAVLFNSLNVSFDWFKKETKSILQNPRIPAYIGAINNPASNVGTMENTGVELELSYRKKIGEVELSINGNITHIKNEVTFIGNNMTILNSGDQNFQSSSYPITRTSPGQPYGSFFGFQTQGIFQTQQEVDSYVDKNGNKIQPDAKPGDFRWLDLDGNGQITEKDRTFIGNPTPDWTYGFTLTAAWKGFDVTVFGQGVAGNEIFQGLRRLDIITTANWQTKALDRWTGPGTSNTHPRLTTKDVNGNFTNPSPFYLENGSYFRLKTFQLGYTLPVSIVSKAGLTNARLYVMSQNLFTITEYTGYDPEIGGAVMSIDRGIYPQARSFMIGVNLGF